MKAFRERVAPVNIIISLLACSIVSANADDYMNENKEINDVNEDQESDDENATVDENQNLKDFIVDDEEDSESDGWLTYVKNVIYKIY